MLEKLKKYQPFWNLAGFLARYYPLKNFQEAPAEIIIEPTNACNLRCPVCPTHFAMKREKGFIDLELFKMIIDEFRGAEKKPKIFLNFSGEPLLNQNIGKLVEYAHKNGHFTFISTNTTLLTEEMSEKLINAGLDAIHICLEGMTKKAHEEYRRGSVFENVKKNIEDFAETRRKLGKKNPRATLQVLLTSYSENQTDELAAWAESIGLDEINFKSLSLGSYTTDETKKKLSYLLPVNEKYCRKISGLKKTVCSIPLKQALVYWNGGLGLCCVDFDNAAELPNIKKDGFLKTFTSAETAAKRKMAFIKKYDLCQKCSLGNADFMGMNIKFKRDV